MQYNTPPGKDPQLWQLAQRRASFRAHFTIYLLMQVFFWLLWYFTGGSRERDGFPWPVWPMLGWGIGVVSHYLSAYGPRSGPSAVEREYEKLTNRNL